MPDNRTLSQVRQSQHTPQQPTTTNEPLCDSVRSAAEYSSLSQFEIRKLINEGKVEARRHGRRILVIRSSLRAYIESLPS